MRSTAKTATTDAMIVAVASGKGGTGKTTVATNLALSIGTVHFIDCDVEEPNANVFLKADIASQEDVTVKVPEIDDGRCDYCGDCADFCAYNALAVVPGQVLVFPELCHACLGCRLVCPRDAITFTERPVGILEHGTTNDISFSHGLLNVGEIQAIPLIKALKHGLDGDVIIDAPPGTSCPVIESVQDADYAILVTEPTPFGLHDLQLMVDVMEQLHIPYGVVINRNGIGDAGVEDFCREKSIPVLMRIPQSTEIARLYSRGEAFVASHPEWQQRFRGLWERIRSEVAE
ncbi:MAG: ATP-binding protein [Thermoplasmatota archaeon]